MRGHYSSYWLTPRADHGEFPSISSSTANLNSRWLVAPEMRSTYVFYVRILQRHTTAGDRRSIVIRTTTTRSPQTSSFHHSFRGQAVTEIPAARPRYCPVLLQRAGEPHVSLSIILLCSILLILFILAYCDYRFVNVTAQHTPTE